jgi:hypothetical protein
MRRFMQAQGAMKTFQSARGYLPLFNSWIACRQFSKTNPLKKLSRPERSLPVKMKSSAGAVLRAQDNHARLNETIKQRGTEFSPVSGGMGSRFCCLPANRGVVVGSFFM